MVIKTNSILGLIPSLILTLIVITALLLLSSFNQANSEPNPHQQLIDEYTFEVFCNASGNIALIANNNPETLGEVLEGIVGSHFSDNYNRWVQSLIDSGKHSRLPDDKLFKSVYEYCLTSKKAKSIYQETIPPNPLKESFL